MDKEKNIKSTDLEKTNLMKLVMVTNMLRDLNQAKRISDLLVKIKEQ